MLISDSGYNIIKKIESFGFEAYFVGGCVRDALMGRPIGDIDITTNASPADIMNIFEKTIPTGIAHGTVTVIEDGISAEVTTYRCDADYADSRHPENVQFISSIEEDLKRRDFTVNSIAYNPIKGYVDVFGGLGDIKNKVIKCVGDAGARFCEDALRMMRAIRFSSVLGFNIVPETLAAIQKNAYLISNISKERIGSEFEKSILGDFPENAVLFAKTGISEYFVDCEDAIIFSNLKKLSELPKNTALRFSRILKKDKASQFLKELKFSTKIINLTAALIEGSGMTDIIEIKKYINKYGFDTATLLKHINGKVYFTLLEKITTENHPVFMRELAVNGKDLNQIGITGKQTGEVLSLLLQTVWNNPSLNTKPDLLSIAKTNKRKAE